MTISLYELVSEDGSSACPYVWRVKYALAQKKLDYEIVRIGLVDIPNILGGRYSSVPVMVLDGLELGDSWLIADHLDQAFPDAQPLFGCPAERAMVRYFDNWMSTQILAKLLNIYALDIHDNARPVDRAYFRQSREARMGKTLEQFVSNRDEVLVALRASFDPMRKVLAEQDFVGGSEPNYADFIAIGVIIWVTGFGSLPLFAADDPLLDWVERCRGLYDRLGHTVELRGLVELPAANAPAAEPVHGGRHG